MIYIAPKNSYHLKSKHKALPLKRQTIRLKHKPKSIYRVCNIPNFGPNIYRHEPIDFDVILIFYFYILVERPHYIWTWWFSFILGVSQLLMIYIFLFVLGVDPEAHDLWDVLCWAGCSWAHEWLMICVERGALEHMVN